ncbi:MAG: S8 family serine peptidase, partial [Anaerolineae bacterium]
MYKIDPSLRKRLLIARPDERIPIVIEMRQQADLESASLWAARADRAEAIVNTLQATALQSQIGVRAFLAAGVIAGRASEVRPFWIFNGLAAHVVAEDITTLAARDDVGLIREDRYRQWVIQLPGVLRATTRLASRDHSTTRLASVEWGIAKIGADEVWTALNISGAGVVVANMDTGVDWQHPALQAAYRGYNKGLTHHPGNWYDATDGGAIYPIDPHGHGTHTMGTLVGSNGIGVAPGARWIAARTLNAEGFGYDSWIHAGFQWILAPDGDPARAPDVLSNSWGNSVSDDTTFQNDLRLLRSAGTFVVFSNGNGGPLAASVGSPASLPEAFAAGATDIEDIVASFSSRGPSPWGEVRPHASAPGVSVRSSIPGGGYTNASGTSMAAPHVAGTIALMLSADPSLTIADAAFALTSTAVPLSTTIPNNDTGYGRIDAYAAVR